MFSPRDRVTVAPLTDGPALKGRLVSKVNDLGAWVVATNGRRITVSEAQLSIKTKEKGA